MVFAAPPEVCHHWSRFADDTSSNRVRLQDAPVAPGARGGWGGERRGRLRTDSHRLGTCLYVLCAWPVLWVYPSDVIFDAAVGQWGRWVRTRCDVAAGMGCREVLLMQVQSWSGVGRCFNSVLVRLWKTKCITVGSVSPTTES